MQMTDHTAITLAGACNPGLRQIKSTCSFGRCLRRPPSDSSFGAALL
jgi:hypothetical protein